MAAFGSSDPAGHDEGGCGATLRERGRAFGGRVDQKEAATWINGHYHVLMLLQAAVVVEGAANLG